MYTYSLKRLAPLGALALLAFSSCAKEELTTGSINPSRYAVSPGGNQVVFTDATGTTGEVTLVLRPGQASQLQLFAKQTISQAQAETYTISYDASALESYNASHGTSYPLLPEGAISFPEGTQLSLPEGQVSSVALPVAIDVSQLPAATSSPAVYLLPLQIIRGNSPEALPFRSFYCLVRDEREVASAEKESGIILFSIPEVNDTNPLNTLSFTLRNSGKPLIDAVILFSSNINYDDRTGRVYIHHNENVTALLANKDKYLKPLKDRGIKVLLSILGNHDRAGVANLSDASARLFAQEIKHTCDAYDLDGVMLDDEYSNYSESYGEPGFVSPSTSAMSRLYYEIKQAQPHRWNVVYAYGRSTSLYTVEGRRPGDYIDFALHDYGGSWDLSSYFPGLPRARQGLYSQEFAQGRFAYDNQLLAIKNGGYKTHMIFAMDPYRSSFAGQLESMRRMARIFYSDELVDSGVRYPKDWK